jgi:hypothetical protein
VEGINVSQGSPVIRGNIIDHNEVGITVSLEASPQIGENVLVHNDIDMIIPDPKDIAGYTKDLLEEAKTGDKKLDKKLDKAIDFIQRSLNIDPEDPDRSWKKYPLWEDASHLNPKQGHKVFNEIKKTVKVLMKIIDDDNPQDVVDTSQVVINKLIFAVDLIAQTAYEEAQVFSGINKVDMELATCESELTKVWDVPV